MRKRKRGVLTVFISLMLTFILMFCCIISEGVRFSGAQIQAQAVTDSGVDSLFSEYHRLLMESYGLFFISGDYDTDGFAPENVEARLTDYITANLQPEDANILLTNTDFWGLSVEACRVTGYLLATDDDCAAYRRQAAEVMETQIGRDMLAKLFSWEEDPVNVDELEASFADMEAQNEQEIERLEEEAAAEEAAEQTEADGSVEGENDAAEASPLTNGGVDSMAAEDSTGSEDSGSSDESVSNPIEVIKELKKRGILQLVMQNPEKVSSKSISMDNTASNRALGTGNLEAEEEGSMEALTEKVLFYEYLLGHFSNCLEEKELSGIEDTALSYEMEYVIAGKSSDLENLKAVVNKLVLMREAVNFAYLLTDTTKQMEAEALALTITGLLSVAPLAEAVKYGILLAWAYGESIMDVRNLMNGGTLALVKTASDWQLSLDNIGSLVSGNDGTAIKQTNGLSYQDYLRLLLYSKKDKVLTLRSLDLIELNIQQQTGSTTFLADSLIERMTVEVDYQMSSKFLSFRFMKSYTNTPSLCMTVDQAY